MAEVSAGWENAYMKSLGTRRQVGRGLGGSWCLDKSPSFRLGFLNSKEADFAESKAELDQC